MANDVSRWPSLAFPNIDRCVSTFYAAWQETSLGETGWHRVFGGLIVLTSAIGVAPSTSANFGVALKLRVGGTRVNVSGSQGGVH